MVLHPWDRGIVTGSSTGTQAVGGSISANQPLLRGMACPVGALVEREEMGAGRRGGSRLSAAPTGDGPSGRSARWARGGERRSGRL